MRAKSPSSRPGTWSWVCSRRSRKTPTSLQWSRSLSTAERGESQRWNHVQVNGQIARERVLNWLIQECESFPGFRPAMIDYAWQEIQRLECSQRKSGSCVGIRISSLEAQSKRLATAIAAGIELDSLVVESQEIKRQLDKLYRQQRKETSTSITTVN